ncbi:MAG: undecaprenyl/decaprenyl-phosphate alpha-N-acetylglucosaminyl 1-phosphate transferase [Verrucomicrobia bacterium]|nr:undecaprenyl/decaprenyl-phosphate alpha-N-acetylglucosaminyl 1-phosphate transferase [Verrucomicrobiota bacterium]
MQIYPSIFNILMFLGALILCATGTWIVLRNPLRVGLDQPDARRKLHEVPTPRLGGLPIFITLLAGFAVAALRFPGFLDEWWPVILTNVIIFTIGFLDDVKPLGAKVKFLGQIGAACILYSLDVSIDDLTNPFRAGAHFLLGPWSFPVTVLWLVAIPNIINLIDGMDGLASGFGLLLSLTLAFVGHFGGKPEMVLISVVMSGALSGFLVFNFPPAKIFLGDGGAYLIGFFIASSSLLSAQKGSILASLLVVIVALGVPILDTLFAIIRRGLRGIPIFRADAEHVHHRLVLMGFSKSRALVALYSVSLVLSLLGISLLARRGLAGPIVAATVFLLALFAVRYLGYVKSWRQLRAQVDEALARRRDMLYSSVYGRATEWEAERCATVDEFKVELVHALGRCGLHLNAVQNSESLPLQLIDGSTCLVYGLVEDATVRERWLAKADLFLPALNHAIERWKIIPGLNVTAATSENPVLNHAPKQQT